MGGGYTFLFWLTVLGFMALCELVGVLQTYWLGYWATQYELHDQGEVKVV